MCFPGFFQSVGEWWKISLIQANKRVKTMSSGDIIKLILAPPPSTTTSDVESWCVSSAMTFVVDGIWNLRNKVVFQGEKVDIREAYLRIQSRIIEFRTVI